ncbi:MAG: hypothetical protein H6Q66_92 [Firmicutes bacterium]|nr:hypothetical protein [Bacillota bacterium]
MYQGVIVVRWRRQFFLLVAAVVFCLLPAPVVAAADTVDSIVVNVTSDVPPPARIVKRMTGSVTTVGEQILLGKTVGDVLDRQAAYEKIIQEVFDRVLVGYTVQAVSIDPGIRTTILITLTPWGDVVRDVSVEMDYGSLSPASAELVRQDVGDITEKVRNLLVGLPIDAVDWAGSLSKTLLREYLEGQLPEFRAGIDIVPGSVTTVRVSLLPQGPVVQDVQLSLRSKTIPNVLLLTARPDVEATAGELRGLPVAFVERHHAYFANRIGNQAAQLPAARRYELKLTPMLEPGRETRVTLNAETDRYKVTLEGHLDMGREQDNTAVQLHAGKYISNRDEAFMEVVLFPNQVSWQFLPGWGHRVGTNTTLGIKYNIGDKQAVLWLQQPLARNWSFRLERTPAISYTEVGIRYKFHDFISAEYVFTNHDNWLRLVGDL